MKVTGHLREPVLEPCPNRDDLKMVVDDTCAPAVCTRPRGGINPGVDCCQFWTAPDTWQSARIRVDQIDPEKFKYEQFRYQLYAKPADFDCMQGIAKLERVPDRVYNPPVTDIRPLRQTTTVPIIPGGVGGAPAVPSNPGGIPDVTFPMTQTTLGQPDVTTACCVPVVPCQQGFKNLTSRVRQDARCQQPPPPGRPQQQLGPQRTDPCAQSEACSGQRQAEHNLSIPPANQQGAPGSGFPPVFPQTQQTYNAYSAPHVQRLQLPQPEFKAEAGAVQDGEGQGQAGQCFDSGAFCIATGLEDGMNPRGGVDTACTNVSTFRFQDRVMREFNSMKETPGERRERLTRMSGAYGSALQPKQKGKRALAGPKDNIVLQGNGFSWGGYPRNENRLCYVLERNHRC